MSTSAIPPAAGSVSGALSTAYSGPIPAHAKASERAREVTNRTDGARIDPRTQSKQQLNVQILEAASKVSLKAGDESQSLLFKAAIDGINEALAPTLGPDAIQKAAKSQDNSPEATAGRILSFTTGLFAAYAAQRPNDDQAQVAKDFVDLVRGGFEKGFNEAKDILEGLKVFDGEVKSGVSKTYELVQKGFDDFLANLLKPKEAETATTPATTTTAAPPPTAAAGETRVA